jgi:acyl-CoA synthetase (AMP-forming)/AMP-acid ligase II
MFASCGFRREAFYPCYGLAEATLLVSGGAQNEAPIARTFQAAPLAQNQVVPAPGSTEQESRSLVSCGRQLQAIAIVDPATRLRCQPDQVGEIWVSGPSIAQGYWNQPAATADTFQAYLADTGVGPYLRTGDLGFVHDAELFVTGRLKDLIIIRGRNYYPHDIELSVEQCHPALRVNAGAAFSVEVEHEERLQSRACGGLDRRGKLCVSHSRARVMTGNAHEQKGLTITPITCSPAGGEMLHHVALYSYTMYAHGNY